MMDSFLALEWVIGVGLVSLLLGFGVAWLIFGGKKSSRTRVKDLESELQRSQDELTQYRSEVYGQFSATAEKFRALDKSYHDLHRQLAASSVALIGDQAAPLLLEGQTGEVDQSQEVVVDEADDLPIVEEARPAEPAADIAEEVSEETAEDVPEALPEEVVEEIVDPEVITHDGAEDDSSVEVQQEVVAQRPAG
jgi:uncharacterized membrane-anchored protein YhcB (DUF1043 family)